VWVRQQVHNSAATQGYSLVYLRNTGYDARLYAETRAHDHLKTHVLVQSLGNGSASSILQAIPSQVQGVQRHIVQQALCQILGP